MTLQRVLEPEVMDTVEEARDYNQMDHSGVNQLFVSDLFAAGFSGGDVLDLGTGTALIPIELCQQSANAGRLPRLRIMAIDLAIQMLELARYNIEIAGFREQIQLARVDAKRMPYSDGMFDVVMSNSIVHHIPEPAGVLGECMRVVRPGGLIFIRDLMRPNHDQDVKRLVETYAGQENEHSKKMFDDSLRAALSLQEIRNLVSALGADPNSVNPTSDRHWTWSCNKPGTNQ